MCLLSVYIGVIGSDVYMCKRFGLVELTFKYDINIQSSNLFVVANDIGVCDVMTSVVHNADILNKKL